MKKFLVALTLALVLALGCVVIASADTAEKTVVAFGDLSSITSIGGHAVVPFNPDKDKLFSDPTCTAEGIAYFHCKEPSHVNGIHVLYVEKKPHTWGEETVAATCTSTGTLQQVCKVCGAKGNTYVIPKTDHVFDKIAYYYAPSCSSEGYGYKVCKFCGTPEVAGIDKTGAPKSIKEARNATYTPADATRTGTSTENWVRVPKLQHKWSDWKYEKKATCLETGSAYRTCKLCGSIEVIDAESMDYTVYYVSGKEVTFEEYEKETDTSKKSTKTIKAIAPDISIKNPGYAAFQTGYDAKTAEQEKTLAAADMTEAQLKTNIIDAAKTQKVEIELKNNEFLNCYVRKVTYVCPYCKSTLKNAAGEIVHKPIVVYVETAAHTWTEKPIDAVDLPIKFNTQITTSVADVATDDEIKAYVLGLIQNNDGTLKEAKSYKPTCELYGVNVYLCKFDTENQKDTTKFSHAHAKKDDYLVELVAPLGHQWTAWEDVDIYPDGDKQVIVRTRKCTVCDKTEHKTEDYVAPVVPVKDGLTKDEDGTWRYYKDGEFQDDLTAHIVFEGEKFLVINGELAEDCDGLVLSPVDNTFHLMVDGQLQNDSTTVVYGDDTFMVINGVLNTEANGLYDYNGGKFVFAAGRLIKTVNGLWLNPQDNKFYYLANGQVQTQHSGVVEYNGEFFVVKNGVFDSSYNGTIEYDGKTFNVSNGQLYAIPVAEEPAA